MTRFPIGTFTLLLKIKKHKLGELLGQNNLEFTWSIHPALQIQTVPACVPLGDAYLFRCQRPKTEKGLRDEMLPAVGGATEGKTNKRMRLGRLNNNEKERKETFSNSD